VLVLPCLAAPLTGSVQVCWAVGALAAWWWAARGACLAGSWRPGACAECLLYSSSVCSSPHLLFFPSHHHLTGVNGSQGTASFVLSRHSFLPPTPLAGILLLVSTSLLLVDFRPVIFLLFNRGKSPWHARESSPTVGPSSRKAATPRSLVLEEQRLGTSPPAPSS